MTGREAIHPYWSEIPDYHRDVSFRWDVLEAADERAIVHWRTTYTAVKTGKPTTTDGIFLLEFDRASGLCRSLREWWHADPAPGF
jgi:SnoaL-like domain